MLGQSHLRSKPCFYVLRKPAFGAIQPTTLGMGAAEMQEIAAIIASVLPATAPTRTASRTGRLAGKPFARQLHARRSDPLPGRRPRAGPAGALPSIPRDRALGRVRIPLSSHRESETRTMRYVRILPSSARRRLRRHIIHGFWAMRWGRWSLSMRRVRISDGRLNFRVASTFAGLGYWRRASNRTLP